MFLWCKQIVVNSKILIVSGVPIRVIFQNLVTFSTHLLFWQVYHAGQQFFFYEESTVIVTGYLVLPGNHNDVCIWQLQCPHFVWPVKPLFWDSAHLWFLYILCILNHRIPTWHVVSRISYMGTAHTDCMCCSLSHCICAGHMTFCLSKLRHLL